NAKRLGPNDVRGELSFKNVGFTYTRDEPSVLKGLFGKESSDNGNREAKRIVSPEPLATAIPIEEAMPAPTLNDISFDIQPGQLEALLGPSGAGRTTITILLPRFYAERSGALEMVGTTVKEMAL